MICCKDYVENLMLIIVSNRVSVKISGQHGILCNTIGASIIIIYPYVFKKKYSL